MTARSSKSKISPPQTSEYPCLCAVMRKAGRILTRRYDQSLRPSGLKLTQYSMLANIERNPDVSVSELAGLLVMDQTTVTRNLRVLQKLGYIHLEPDMNDHRIKRIRISEAGTSKMDEARPLWKEAQSQTEGILGRANIEGILDSLRNLGG
jgi:DNA-binding MarR family transcriptional regulator